MEHIVSHLFSHALSKGCNKVLDDWAVQKMAEKHARLEGGGEPRACWGRLPALTCSRLMLSLELFSCGVAGLLLGLVCFLPPGGFAPLNRAIHTSLLAPLSPYTPNATSPTAALPHREVPTSLLAPLSPYTHSSAPSTADLPVLRRRRADKGAITDVAGMRPRHGRPEVQPASTQHPSRTADTDTDATQRPPAAAVSNTDTDAIQGPPAEVVSNTDTEPTQGPPAEAVSNTDTEPTQRPPAAAVSNTDTDAMQGPPAEAVSNTDTEPTQRPPAEAVSNTDTDAMQGPPAEAVSNTDTDATQDAPTAAVSNTDTEPTQRPPAAVNRLPWEDTDTDATQHPPTAVVSNTDTDATQRPPAAAVSTTPRQRSPQSPQSHNMYAGSPYLHTQLAQLSPEERLSLQDFADFDVYLPDDSIGNHSITGPTWLSGSGRTGDRHYTTESYTKDFPTQPSFSRTAAAIGVFSMLCMLFVYRLVQYCAIMGAIRKRNGIRLIRCLPSRVVITVLSCLCLVIFLLMDGSGGTVAALVLLMAGMVALDVCVWRWIMVVGQWLGPPESGPAAAHTGGRRATAAP